MEIKKLQEEVETSLQEIVAMPNGGNFLCHEVARLIRKSLNMKGHKVVIKDGIARYDGNFLVELFEQSSGEGVEASKSQYGQSGLIAHSWCELDSIVIDHQSIIRIPPHLEFEHVTIVKKKSELQGKVDYNPVGREFRMFGRDYVCIPNGFNVPYITRLRI